MEENNAPLQKQGTPHTGLLDEKTFSKYFLLSVFLLSLVAFLWVIKIFMLEIVLAVVFSTLFYPLFAALLKLFGNRRAISALVTCVLILLGILIPIIFISNLVVLQGVELYHTAGAEIRDIIQKGDAGLLGQIKNSSLGRMFSLNDIDWQDVLNSSFRYFGANIAKFINKTSRTTVLIIVDLLVVLFTIFYFLKDGERIVRRVREIVPLSEEYKDRIVSSFHAISRATVRGTLLIALIQTFLATMTLWLFGIDAWLLWGVVMLVFSVIPFVGTGAVLVPAGIIKIVTGDVASGVAIILISIGFISLIDNFLRPRLVGRHAGMHDLLVFFSSLGGISVFGPVGFIVGPLIAAIFLTILDIFSIEFQEHIEYSRK